MYTKEQLISEHIAGINVLKRIDLSYTRGFMCDGPIETINMSSFLNGEVRRREIYQLQSSYDKYMVRTRRKTGGNLFFTSDGLIINQINSEPATIWQEIVSGLPIPGTDPVRLKYIPVAPILLDKTNHFRVVPAHNSGNDWQNVFSRFCGINIEMAKEDINYALFNLNQISSGDTSVTEMKHDLEDVLVQIKAQTAALWVEMYTTNNFRYTGDGVVNHFRDENLTVEYIRANAYRKYYHCKPGLNTRFRNDEVTFDLREYLMEPKSYQIVVRVIDFQHIQKK